MEKKIFRNLLGTLFLWYVAIIAVAFMAAHYDKIALNTFYWIDLCVTVLWFVLTTLAYVMYRRASQLFTEDEDIFGMEPQEVSEAPQEAAETPAEEPIVEEEPQEQEEAVREAPETPEAPAVQPQEQPKKKKERRSHEKLDELLSEGLEGLSDEEREYQRLLRIKEAMQPVKPVYESPFNPPIDED
jgi:hypothetical protein